LGYIVNSQNRLKITFNPISGELEFVNDLEMGFTTRNVCKAPFFVKSGYTRFYPNLSVPEDMTIEVRDGGELQVT